VHPHAHVLARHCRCVTRAGILADGRRLAAVAGTQEPEYGPDAIQPVGKKLGDPAYTELAKKDLRWITLDYTNVETQTFYLFTDTGHIGFLQVIYNNIA
jgi:hypothetical protein